MGVTDFGSYPNPRFIHLVRSQDQNRYVGMSPTCPLANCPPTRNATVDIGQPQVINLPRGRGALCGGCFSFSNALAQLL
jgi:hypothetical protein